MSILNTKFFRHSVNIVTKFPKHVTCLSFKDESFSLITFRKHYNMAGTFGDCATKIKKPPEPICPLRSDPKVTKDQILCWQKVHPNKPLDIHSIILDRRLDLSERLIMAPPPYSDLGKRSRDVFGKGYHFGLIKLDVKTKTAAGVEFNTSGSSNQETGKVSGSLETKYKVKEYGLTFSEKWNTDNTLTTGVELKDQIAQGLKIALEGNFSPQTGYLGTKLSSNFETDIELLYSGKVKLEFNANSSSKSGIFKTAYENDFVSLNADADLNVNGPIIQASAVAGHQGWLAGYQTAFDTGKSKLTRNNFALGFSTGDFILHTNVDYSDDGQEFGGAIYQKINQRLETGVNLAWSAGSNNTKFGIGAKYDLDLDASLRAKINNQSQIGLGYQQKLREGITLTLSALIDGKNFNNGGHKIGLALELEA